MSKNISPDEIKNKSPVLGFFSLLALVISSQIGAGALSMPTVFAPLGISGFFAWITIGFVVLILAYIFAQLSIALPYTGGPHVYIKHAFGNATAFFAGWLYWLVSWISTTIILIECMGYLNQILHMDCLTVMLVGLIIWTGFNYLNYIGIQQATQIEVALTIVKLLFFMFFILISLKYFNIEHISSASFNIPAYKTGLASAMWCFIGLEVATVPAGMVENPKTAIPRAIIVGTIIVIGIYISSIIGVMGVVSHNELAQTAAPYALIAEHIFGPTIQMFFALLVFFICAGSLNAWVLISGQVAAGLAEDKLLPKKFAELHNGIPYFGILISFVGVSLIWICGSYSVSLMEQMIDLINCTVPAFILIYMICCMAFIKIYKQVYNRLIGVIGIFSCACILYSTSLSIWLIILCLLLSGLPLRTMRD